MADRKHRAGNPAPEVVVLLATLAVVLFALQYATLSKLSVFPASMFFGSASLFFKFMSGRIDLDELDFVLIGLLLLLCFATIVIEIMRQRLSLFLTWIFASEHRTVALLVVSSFVATRFYWALGDINWAADSCQHITYALLTSQAFANGEWPHWTNAVGAGSPYLEFYGFLFFYFVGLLDQIVSDIDWSLKFVLVACHLLSGVTMYYLAQNSCRSRRAAFVAGIGYVLCMWHTQQVLIMGRLPLALLYALLPVPFWLFERLATTTRPWTTIALSALSLGAILLTHPGYGLWTLVFFVVYTAIRLLPAQRWMTHGRAPLAMLIIGGTYGAYLLVPMGLDRGYTGLAQGFSLSNFPAPTLHHLLVWSNFQFWLLPFAPDEFHWYGGYLGITLFACALLSWPRNMKAALKSRATSALVGLGGSLLFALGYHTFVFVPGFEYMNASRFLLFATFFLSLCTAHGVKHLLFLRIRGHVPTWGYVALLLAIGVDLGATTFRHPYSKPGGSEKDPLGYPRALYDSLRREAKSFTEEGKIPNYRIFWSLQEQYPNMALGQVYYNSGTPIVQGMHPGELRAQFAFIKPFERFLNAVLKGYNGNPTGVFELDEINLISAGLAMLNVEYLFVSQEGDGIFALRWPHRTPILVTPRASAAPPDIDLLDILEGTGINAEARRSDRLLLTDFSGDIDLGTEPIVTVVDHIETNNRVELVVETSAPCFARLAYAYYPHIKVTVNGSDVEPLQTAEGFFALTLPTGKHTIVLEPHLSFARSALLVLNLVMLAATAFIIWWERRK